MSPGDYPYDRVPFRSTSVPDADCRRLELIARLFGVTAAPCAEARVLELGCGGAANLIPLALEHPRACFIGCDLSRRALASAERLIDGLRLTNVELRHADICDVDEGWGTFDYVVCHDVFSWVDPGLRQKILSILRRNLNPLGVGYVSFDALPGWQLRGIVRDMMRYHAAGESDPHKAVAQARAMLAMGAAVQDQKPGPYAELLREEYYLFSTIGDEQLYHLAFSEHHQAFYFDEFVRLVGEAGLQLLGDSDVSRLFGPREPAAVCEWLDRLPRLALQQYLDFLTNCTCRRALVCHGDVQVRDRPDEGVLHDSWIGVATSRRAPVANDPLARQTLSALETRRPEFVAFSELAQNAGASPRVVLDAYAGRLVDVALSPLRLSSRISDRPTVSPLVRLQAADDPRVTNQKCEPVRLTDVARHVVTLLDGIHSPDDVARSLSREIQSGTVASDWMLRQADGEWDAQRLTNDILRHLRDHALLVA